jgi:hypothetical protein
MCPSRLHHAAPDNQLKQRIAVEACVTINSVANYFRGRPMRSTTAASIERAMDSLGLSSYRRPPANATAAAATKVG